MYYNKKAILVVVLTILLLTAVPSFVLAYDVAEQSLNSEFVGYESHIVPYDTEDLFNMFFESMSNNSSFTEEEKYRLASELTNSAIKVRNDVLQGDGIEQQNDKNVTTVILGQISDGELIVDNDPLYDYLGDQSIIETQSVVKYIEYLGPLDSRESITSHGFAITPYRVSYINWMTHGDWKGINHYTNEANAVWIADKDYQISKTMGYSGSLYSSDASAYGLTVSPSTKYSQKVPKSETFYIPKWSAKYIRPIILWKKSTYKAKYEFYTYNSFNQTYKYYTVNLDSENDAYNTKRNQFWEAVNTTENPNAPIPNPPAGYWLE